VTKSDFKIGLIEEPELCFGHEQRATFAKDGLLWFGPIDDIQKPSVLRVGFVGSPKGFAFYKDWVKKINLPVLTESEATHHIPFPGFEAVFNSQWPETPTCALKMKLFALKIHFRPFITVLASLKSKFAATSMKRTPELISGLW